jgi:hypothetical protein
VVESEVAVLDAIRVEHGDDLEDEEFTQDHACLALSQQKVDEAFNEVGGRCLGRMYPRCQEDHRTVLQSKSTTMLLQGSIFGIGKDLITQAGFLLSICLNIFGGSYGNE